MRPIPIELREEMSQDPYMSTCCMAGIGDCVGRIEWHHNLIFAGRQVNEKWCILPLCKRHHDNIDGGKAICNWIMLNRATDEELKPYCKAIDYIDMRRRLNNIYGKDYNPVG